MTSSARTVVQVCPWYNKEEFDAVRHGLFSNNLFEMKWASDRLSLWESKSYPGLEVGMDATGALVRSIIQHELLKNKGSVCQVQDLQLMYSMALIRFVNVISHIATNKQNPSGTRIAAQKMGIPEWIVHLRNDACHGRLPSLTRLRSGAVVALQWLNKRFWEDEKTSFTDFVPIKDTEGRDFISFISLFQTLQFEFIHQNETSTKSRNIMANLLKSINKVLEKTPKDFFNVMLQSGFFFPSLQYLSEVLKDNDTSFLEKKTIDLPVSLMMFWNPLIVAMIQNNCLQEFVEELFACLSQKNALIQKISACWIYSILSYDKRDGSPYENIQSELLPCFNWIRLLGACITNCCDLTPALLPFVIEQVDPPLEESNKANIMGLVAIYLGAVAPSSQKINNIKEEERNSFFTVDALKDDLYVRDSDRSSIWHQAPDDIDWSTIPLGFVFGDQNKFTLNIQPDHNIEEAEPENTEEYVVKEHSETQIDSVQENAYSEPIKPNPGQIFLYPSEDEDDDEEEEDDFFS